MSTDCIQLTGIACEAIMGVYDWERLAKRPLVFDLKLMGINTRQAAQTDDVQDTLDYQAVTEGLQQLVGASQYKLLETLAEHVATWLFDTFAVPKIEITLHKPNVLEGVQDVCITIVRDRHA